jgi:hypothetical protein
MFDERIIPGAWVQTRYGKAVCIVVEPHDHSLVMRHPKPGYIIHPCEDDSCKDQRYVMFRYRSRRCIHDSEGKVIGYADKDIWVANGDISGGDRVTFLAPPTRFTARILKLEGPYGEGKPKCGPYIEGYCACGDPVHA